MKPAAIVYTSNTGHTRKYALLLGEQIGLPAYSLEEAGSQLSGGSPVIYLGWLHASHVKGYAKPTAVRASFRPNWSARIAVPSLAPRSGTPPISTAAPFGSATANLQTGNAVTLLWWTLKPYSGFL